MKWGGGNVFLFSVGTEFSFDPGKNVVVEFILPNLIAKEMQISMVVLKICIVFRRFINNI